MIALFPVIKLYD